MRQTGESPLGQLQPHPDPHPPPPPLPLGVDAGAGEGAAAAGAALSPAFDSPALLAAPAAAGLDAEPPPPFL